MTSLEFVLMCSWLCIIISDKSDDLRRSNWKGYLNESNCPRYLLNITRFMHNPKKRSREEKKNTCRDGTEDVKRQVKSQQGE